MNYLKKSGSVTALALTMILNVSPAMARGLEHPGLKEMTNEEGRRLHKHKVKRVRPNRLGLERVNKERARRGEAPLAVDPQLPEVELEESFQASSPADGSTSLGATAIAAQVDNSVLPSFPPIANQGSLGTCVPFASTYYMMSHEVCLTLGCNNKNSNTHIYSPKWTYNLINGGVDNGSYFSDAFAALERHGAVSIADLPYDADYKSWDMNSLHWKNAINMRMKPNSYSVINTDAGMANVKQILSNGHVLIFGTYINSWVYTTVKARAGVNSPFAGQSVATHLNGKVAGHAMTIVGYDDDIWTDINGNGVVESQELGAYKIANSFGNSWKNQGYAWAAYDAFRATSTVPNFSVASRVQVTQNANAFYSTYVPYTPTLLAEVKMSHAMRSQIGLQFGSSANTATNPTATWTPYAFANRGGDLAFDGTNLEKSASFYFDISSLASSNPSAQKFYLTLTDSKTGSYFTTQNFNIVSPAAGNTLLSAAGVPLSLDGNSIRLVAGTTAVDTTAPPVPSNLRASLRTGRSAKITVYWSASSDDVKVARYELFRNGVQIGQTTSTSYSDSAITRGVTYSYQVRAIDTSGNASDLSSSVFQKW